MLAALAFIPLTGCGGTKHVTSASTSPVSTTTSTGTGAGNPGGQGNHTTTVTTTRTSTTNSAPPPGHASKHPVAKGGHNVGPATKYSGSGDKALGTLKLARDAVLHWTVSGGVFRLTDSSHKLNISGHGNHGQSFAAAGTYDQAKVVAGGQWTLQIQLLGLP